MQNNRVKPASTTWDEQHLVLRLGHKTYFQRYGFTLIPGLLPPDLLERASDEVERIHARHSLLPNARLIGRRNPLLPACDLEEAAANHTGPSVARKITGLYTLSPSLASLLVAPAPLLEVLHDLLGRRVELYRDALMLKAARFGQETAWHQDAVNWPFRPMHLISAMIALDGADRDNGCLQVVPGSHHGLLPHVSNHAELLLAPGEWTRRACYVPLAAGDCLIFHSLLLHASEHNPSNRRRRASICVYSPGHLQCLDSEISAPMLISEKVGCA